jgi:hypothetical protein
MRTWPALMSPTVTFCDRWWGVVFETRDGLAEPDGFAGFRTVVTAALRFGARAPRMP